MAGRPVRSIGSAAIVLGLIAGGRAEALDNVALGKPATQSTEYGGASFPASNAVDGNLGNFTHTSTTDPAPWWEVNLTDTFPISYIIVRNRGDGCCQSRLRDITVTILDLPTDQGGSAVFTSQLLNPESALATPLATGPKELVLDLVALTGAPVDGSAVRVGRTPDPDDSGTREPVPNDGDPAVLALGEVEVYTGDCPAVTGHCDGIQVDGPLNGGPGLYTFTATSADFPVNYRFTLSNGKDPDIAVGPQEDPFTTQLLTAGTWTITAQASPDALCPASNPEATCTLSLPVKECSEDPADTHCQGITVDPPPGGPYAGLYKVTAQGLDDSGDAIAYTFSASNGVDPPQVSGPALADTASFRLTEGTWTVQAALGDNVYCPADSGGDAVCTQAVEVKPLSASPNVATLGTATQSSNYDAANTYPPTNAIDGSTGDFTHTSPTDAGAWWKVDLGEVYAIDAIKITNRQDCCRSRLRDITVSVLDIAGEEVWKSELLNPENVLGNATEQVGPDSLALGLLDLAGGPVFGTMVKVDRTPDDDLSGSSGLGNADEANVLSLAEVEVFGALADVPAAVARSLPTPTFHADPTVPVVLSVTTKSGPAAVKVVEVLPDHTSASNISDNGVLNAGVIAWDLPAVSAATLSYDLVVTDTCSAAVDFPGSTFQSGGVRAAVSGDATLAREVDDGSLAPWVSEDIGSTGGAMMPLGPADAIVRGAGTSSPKKDVLRFVHRTAAGDFRISARIDCASDPGNGMAQFGLMARDTVATDSPACFFYFSVSAQAGLAGNLKARSRTSAGGSLLTFALSGDTAVTTLPVYLQLERAGDTFTFSRSEDGVAWTSLGTKSVTLAANAEVGLGVASVKADPVQAKFGALDFSSGVPAQPSFKRADANADGKVDLTDAIFTLSWLYQGGKKPTCLDAADTNDDGKVDLTDAIGTLGWLYQGGKKPPDPGPTACGPDGTPTTKWNATDCVYTPCQ